MPDITLNSLQFPGLSDTYKIPPQADEFSSTKTYSVGTYVTYRGQLYKCIVAITTAGSWTGSTNWTQINIGDVLENLTTDLSNKLNISSISTTMPNMDGTASAGSLGEVSDAGHIHPHDTSKANQSQLAYVENGSAASKNYVSGEYFCWNGDLYRATTSISSGVSFATGSSGNCINVKTVDYYYNTWTPANVTVSSGVAPRNCYIRSGGILAIYFAGALNSDLANFGTVEVCSDVAATFGVSSILTPFVNSMVVSTYSSSAHSDLLLRLQYNNNKLTLINRSGVVVTAASRTIYGWLLLGII